MARICMVGSWHQAMVYGSGLAEIGHRVVGVCDSAETADMLNDGRPVVHEQGLPELMLRNLKRGRLRYTTDYRDALKGARFAFIAIDTPVGSDDEPILSEVFATAKQIGAHASGDLVLCISAQVPVGTCDQLLATARKAAGKRHIVVAYVPEFLRLGIAIETFLHADRFVVGADEPAVARRVAALYASLKRPVFLTGVRTAEMAKHASNTFLATSISFINQISDLSEAVGADATAVAQILKADRRIGPQAFLSPGLGFAGGTLGRDVKALQRIGADTGVDTPLLDAALDVNLRRGASVLRRLRQALGSLRGKRIAVFGLTYKAGTSTLRRAISLDIIRQLRREDADVATFDPLADLSEVDDLPQFVHHVTPYEAAKGSDGILFLTEWKGIEQLKLRRLRQSMRTPIFVDTKNFFEPERMRRAGFTYLGVGRSSAGRPVAEK